MKATGQFWSEESANWYATIRTYIETCNRNNVNVYNALVMLILGKPYSLKEILSGEIQKRPKLERIINKILSNLGVFLF